MKSQATGLLMSSGGSAQRHWPGDPRTCRPRYAHPCLSPLAILRSDCMSTFVSYVSGFPTAAGRSDRCYYYQEKSWQNGDWNFAGLFSDRINPAKLLSCGDHPSEALGRRRVILAGFSRPGLAKAKAQAQGVQCPGRSRQAGWAGSLHTSGSKTKTPSEIERLS